MVVASIDIAVGPGGGFGGTRGGFSKPKKAPPGPPKPPPGPTAMSIIATTMIIPTFRVNPEWVNPERVLVVILVVLVVALVVLAVVFS